jgi:hypothetical protein
LARLLINGEWFFEVAPTSLYETELENIIFQQAHALFPNFILVKFKKLVFSETSSAKADFALIDKLYKSWWVVEVEMGDHGLDEHVIPQIKTLSQATYGEPEAKFLLESNSNLNESQLDDLIKNIPPKVLVIVNSTKPEWVKPLKTFNADLAIFEIFRSEKNQHIFRVNGKTPVAPEFKLISTCSFLPYLPNILFVENPKELWAFSSKVFRIQYKSWFSIWELVEKNNKYLLVPQNANPLPIGFTYELFLLRDGTLVFEEING